MQIYNLMEYSDNYSKNPEFYGNIVEMSQFQVTMMIF